MERPLFSVVLIGRNEAKTLPVRILKSLEQFRDWGGEVIYQDTGSSDDSREIAAAWGCSCPPVKSFDVQLGAIQIDEINSQFRVEPDPPIVTGMSRIFDFAAARNYADKFASNDAVLVAGCDEFFVNLDIVALNKLISEGKSRMDICYAHSHDSEGRPSIAFRRGVFYSRARSMWVGTVHETIHSNDDVHLPPKEVIYCEHFQEQNPNRQTYLPGLALDCLRHPDNHRNLHYFGRELFYCGQYRSAIRVLTRHVDMEWAWDKEQSQSKMFIGDCQEASGLVWSARSSWSKAFEMDGTRREPLMRLAMHHYRLGNHHKAAAYASACLVLPNEGFYFNETPNYNELPHEILYVSLWWMGQKALSRLHWEIARKLAPSNQKYKDDAKFYE